MDEIVHRILRFDRFALDLTRGCLRLGDRDLELRPKAFAVLLYLVENAGRLVRKEELQKTVWRDIVVSDDSVVQCIRQLRRVLGDDEHLIIKTVSRRGYLLDVQVFDQDFSRTSGHELTSARPADVSGHLSGELSGHHHDAAENHAAQGERKLVTVMYADVKDPLELLSERDPEQALDAFEAILKVMTYAIQRYEGTVNSVTADGILALFGAPLATEDHAERASHAALDIHQAVERYAKGLSWGAKAPIRVRIGLEIGEVVIRSIQNGRQFEPRAMGSTVRAASRLGRLAAPGTSLLGPTTRRLTEGRVEVTTIETGAANSPDNRAFKLVGVEPTRTRFQARIARGLTPFVGRETEWVHLDRARELAGKGHGQVAAIVGEAGVGKSRLVYEFAKTSRQVGWDVLECSSVPYGKAMSYLPIVELLKSYLGIKDTDNLQETRQRVAAVLGSAGGLRDAVEPGLLGLLDVPVDDEAWLALDPNERRRHTLDAVKRLLLHDAQKKPLLVVFEDLHWADNETQALLDLLIDSLGSSRLLLLVTYRLEYRHAWTTKTFYSQLRLDALSSDRTAKLLGALLGHAPELAPLKQRLVRRGNPFFLEETVRSLVETQVLAGKGGRYRLTRPVDAFQVPTSVQTLLAARIDRLSAEDKHLLQVAAVLGRGGPLALLQTVSELGDDALRRRLASLQAAEFVYETQRQEVQGYSFKHALTQEVAYAGLLHERRCNLHARVVGAIEQLYRDQLDQTDDPALISALATLFFQHGDDDAHKLPLSTTDVEKIELLGILRRWVEVVISAPSAMRYDLCEVANAIGRFGLRELLPELKRLLNEDLAHLRKSITGRAEAPRRSDIGASSDAAMRYGNQYQTSFVRIGGSEAAAIAVDYLEDRLFGFDASLILMQISNKQLSVPEPDFYRRWPWFDEVGSARANRAVPRKVELTNGLAKSIFEAIDRLTNSSVDRKARS